MAASLSSGGYICQFLDSAKEEFHCHVCLHVARDPHITSCCGEHFCQTCLAPFLQKKQPCPKCCAEEFTSMLNVKYKQKILNLQVFCTQREKGCEWTGPLSTLSDHLNPSLGECQFLEDLCPNGCGQKVTKSNIDAHLEKECFKRSYRCPYCSYQDTYEVVSNQHTPVCSYVPVRCPNFCGVTCERDTLESHMKICPLEKVDCEYVFAGCKATFLRDDEESHMENSHKQHLSLLTKECARMKDQFTREIEGLKVLLLKEEQARHKQIIDLQKKIENLSTSIAEDADIEANACFVWFPQNIILSNFESERKNPHNRWVSDYHGTHPKGYKYRIVIHPNGVGEGAGTHLSVSFAPSMTVSDSELKWPVKCVITFQLVNQFQDRDHLTITETLSWDMPTNSASFLNISRLFVKHSDLEWNAKKQTLYLHEDTLQFRITKMNILRS